MHRLETNRPVCRFCVNLQAKPELGIQIAQRGGKLLDQPWQENTAAVAGCDWVLTGCSQTLARTVPAAQWVVNHNL